MSILREPTYPIITKEDVKPSLDWLKVDGIFNCGVAKSGGEWILLCRVAESCIKQEEGIINIPVYNEVTDRVVAETICVNGEADRYICDDSRMICCKNTNGIKKIKHLTSLSHLRLARSNDGIHFRIDEAPVVCFEGRYERWGMEDPRVTFLHEEKRYCITYTAVSDLGAMPAMLLTEDFVHFERAGSIFPPENKDVVIFPEKIGGLYYACHRPVPFEIGTPDIWIASSPDLINWGKHRHLYGVQKQGWESGRVGSGCPPLKTKSGWLHIYHAADAFNRYCLGVMLTDLREPGKILAYGRKPVLEPETSYETNGFFGGVVFSCGCIFEKNVVYLYYGAADDKIARAVVTLQDLLDSLETVERNEYR